MSTIAEKLEYIASNEERVYQHGLDRGYGNGYDDGYSGGYNECYDAFWDNFQDYGNRTYYKYAFMGYGWTDETFKPKYKLNLVGDVQNLFRESKIIDLRKGCPDGLDYTNATVPHYPFHSSTIKYAPKIVLGKDCQLNGLLSYSENLETIEEMYFPPVNTTDTTINFRYCYALRRCNINGVIITNINFLESSKIEAEDAINTILHLKDYGADAANIYKHTITFHADVWARLDALGDVSPFGDSWRDYCADLGWLTA